MEGHTAPITAVAITSNNQFVLSGSRDKTIKIWDMSTVELHAIIECDFYVDYMAIISDNQYIIAINGEYISAWNFYNQKRMAEFGKNLGYIETIRPTPNSRYIILGCEDNTIKLLDFYAGTVIDTLQGHTGSVVTVAITSDSRYLISGSEDMTLKVWDLDTRQPYMTLDGHTNTIIAADLTSDDRYVVSSGFDNQLKIWDLLSGKNIATYATTVTVRSCACADSGQIVCGDESGQILILRLEGI